MISVICCYNDELAYQEMLLRSLISQTVACEIIPINNTDNKFSSAAAALNYGASKAQGDYYIFVHQDITLGGVDFVEKLIVYLQKLGPAILGLAGKKDGDARIYTNLRQGTDHKYAGEVRVQQPVEVQTLDECLMAMSREVYEQQGFDEVICNGWHLYGVDLCLCAKTKGIKSYVVPLAAYHASQGIISGQYRAARNRVVAKQRNTYPRIYTTCSDVETGVLKYSYYKIRTSLRRSAKKLLQKSSRGAQ